MPADKNKKGVALIIIFIVVAVLVVLGAAIISSSISEHRIAQRYLESTAAFWLAEAGINQALIALRGDYNLSAIAATALGDGGYLATITHNADASRTVNAEGFIPFSTPYRAGRTIQAVMKKVAAIPTNFYENALYSAGSINISGSSYHIDGDVIYAGSGPSTNPPPANIEGTVTQDASISPLAALDYDQLRVISQSQGNYHDAAHLNGPFPASFWYNETQGIPNIVFLEGSLILKGNVSVGGFFVVGGDVTYDATISGNVSVAGAIYTRGNCTIKGGGSALNIDGGVWTGGNIDLNGGITLNYNLTYMTAIKNLGINTTVQIISWRDMQSPYNVTPQ